MTRSLEQSQEKKIIVVVGEESSGKTCLTRHLAKKDVTRSLAQHRSTIDESHYAIQKMLDGKHEQIQFIDTAPWLEFPVMHKLYVGMCHLVIVVYDVTSKTWKKSLTDTISQVRAIKDTVDIVVVGTHTDELNTFMNITPAHVQDVIGAVPHAYVSSVTSFGINHLWQKLLTTETALTAGHIPKSTKLLHSPKSRRKPAAKDTMKLQKKTKSLSSLLCTSTKYYTL